MSTVKANSHQVGQSVTAANNFTLYQPSTPDGTVRLGNGNSGSVTDLVTLTSAGNLGIGTSSPGQKLVVSGSGAQRFDIIDTGGATGRVSTANGTVYIGTTTNHPLTLFTNDSVKATLDSSGNLGLGVTPSGWYSTLKAIQVGGTASVSHLNAGTGNQQANYGNNFYYNTSGVDTYIQSTGAQRYRQLSGVGHIWEIAPSGTAGNAISFTQAMTLDASGSLYVGGTVNPYSATASGSSYLLGAGATGEFGACNTAATNVGTVGFWKRLNGSGNLHVFYVGGNPPTAVGSITTNGSATAYNTSSDQRLKTNVAPAGSAIQSILDFPVDQFDWISSGEHQDFGAVAQKAIRFIPEMVSVPADPDEMWGIDWSKAVPRLIKTIQELSAELNELKAKVNA